MLDAAEGTGTRVYTIRFQAIQQDAMRDRIGKSKTNYTLKDLRSKKTYYVRIRAYKTVKGVKYYSAWSKVLRIKVK